MSSFLKRDQYLLSILLSLMTCGLGFSSALAAETPTALPTKCVTATTKKLYAADIARFEKDTAPYVGKEAYAKAIQAYRSEIDIAWEAMQQPYCGYGTPGLASSIKSFTKTIERARSAFLLHGKTSQGSSASAAPVAVTAPVPATVPVSAPTSAPATELVVRPSVERVSRGLVQGMRSPAVLALQKRLLTYFGLPVNANSATGFFGPKTRELLVRFQLQKGFISSRAAAGAGVVGPRTTTALNTL